MVLKEDAVEVPSFAFVPMNISKQPSGSLQKVVTPSPVSTTEKLDCTRHRVCLAGISFDANPATILDAKQMIDDFKSLFSFRIVRAANIHNLLELALRMVAEKRKDGYNSRRRDV